MLTERCFFTLQLVRNDNDLNEHERLLNIANKHVWGKKGLTIPKNNETEPSMKEQKNQCPKEKDKTNNLQN